MAKKLSEVNTVCIKHPIPCNILTVGVRYVQTLQQCIVTFRSQVL